MVDPITEQVQRLLAEVFQVGMQDIGPELAFGEIPQWDSMGHMDVMMGLEEQFGVEISTETIGELTSIPAICTYIMENAKHDG